MPRKSAAPKEIGDWVKTRYQGVLAYRYKGERGHRAYIGELEQGKFDLIVLNATGIVPFVPVEVVRVLIQQHEKAAIGKELTD